MDVWKELGKTVGRALKPLADMGAAIWKGLTDSAGDMAESFMEGAAGVSDAVEPLIAPHLASIMEEATESIMPGSPKKEIKEASDKLTKAMMKALEDITPKKGESPPSLEALLAAVTGLIATNTALYISTSGITMGLDLVHPVKELGFREAGMDLINSFQLPAMIGPTLQAPIWSGVIAPLRMRMNQRYPYLIPESNMLPYMRAKDLITEELYQENMRYHALDKTWSDHMLENTARYPSFSELKTMVHRGVATMEDVKGALSKSLVHADFLNGYETLVPSIPSVSDLIRFAVREAYPDATTFTEHYAKMSEWMSKIGFSQYFADAAWTAHWLIPTTSQTDNLLHRGEISEAEHTALYILNDIRPQDIPNLRKLTWKLPGRIEARWMFRWGQIDVDDLRDFLVKDGLDPAYADQAAMAIAKNQFLSDINRQVANIKADYSRGYSVEATLSAELSDLGLRSEIVEFHVLDALADRTRAIHDEELRTLRAQYARGAINMADVVAAVEPIIIDEEARAAWLEALPTAKQVMVVEETYTTEVNRLVANAKYDYVRGYILKEALVSRLQLVELPVDVIEFHVLDADEDRNRRHLDKNLAIIEEGYVDGVIDFDAVKSMAKEILVDEAAYNLFLDEVWLNKNKAKRVFFSE